MSLTLTEIEAANIIGGYYKTDNISTTKRRIRKLIDKAGVEYYEENRTRYLRKTDVYKLTQGIEWQSNQKQEMTQSTGGCAERIANDQSTDLQEYFKPVKTPLKKLKTSSGKSRGR